MKARSTNSRQGKVPSQPTKAFRARLRGLESLESRHLMAGEILQIRLDALQLDGVTPLTQVQAGQEFLLRGQVRDINPNGTTQGAFRVYTDISYSSSESAPMVSEVQMLGFTGNPEGGTFTLTYNGVATAPIPYKTFPGADQAKSIQDALNAIPALNGNVRVDRDVSTNSSLPTNRYFIRFMNGLENTNVNQITANASGLQSDPSGTPAGIQMLTRGEGVRSDTEAFKQAFAYNSWTDGNNPSLFYYPELRQGSDQPDLFDNVGGGAPLSPVGTSTYTYFLARLKAVSGGADGQLVFTSALANQQGLETLMFGSDDPLTASQVKFVYGDSTPNDGLQIPVVSTPSNTAPTLDNSLDPKLITINEDNRYSWGTPIWVLANGATDPDPNSVKGIAVTYPGWSPNGTWEYTLNNGGSWQPLGTVSISAAKLLPADGNNSRIRFVPKLNFNGDVELGYFAWDQTQGTAGGTMDLSGSGKLGGSTAFSTAWEKAQLTVAPVNDGPAITLGGSTGYTAGSPAIVLSSTATVKDPDTVAFTGGWMRVAITAGANASDRLTIGGIYKVVNGDLIFNNSITIGTVDANSGVGSTPLMVRFNANATLYRVEQLVRSIKFSTVGSTTTGKRTVAFSLNDGQDLGNIASMDVLVS